MSYINNILFDWELWHIQDLLSINDVLIKMYYNLYMYTYRIIVEKWILGKQTNQAFILCPVTTSTNSNICHILLLLRIWTSSSNSSYKLKWLKKMSRLFIIISSQTYNRIFDMIFRKTLKEQLQLIEHIHQYGKAYYALYDINFELLKLKQQNSIFCKWIKIHLLTL